jgi:outer membrane protein OmpA-like peptidoglycan-associated protein
MNIGMRLSCACVVAVAPWMLGSALAQEPMLKGNQVTESALIDALSVDPPAGADQGATRGLVRAAKDVRPRAKAGPGKASLLITFAEGSAQLTPESMAVLDTVAKALGSDQLAGNAFRVEGHADPRGIEERNKSLSQARAESVVSYLVSKHGLLPERLSALGKGSSELANPSRPDAPENRRVTIVTNRE